MKPHITLSVDKKKVTEGDIVEITWSCPEVQSAQLVLDNGFKSNSMTVEATGSKKFRLNRSKGKTKLAIEVERDGKRYQESVSVRVKKMKATKTETVYDYTGAKGVRKNGLKLSWQNLKSKMRVTWSYLPENKRLALKVLLLLNIFMLLSLIWPRLTSFAFLVTSFYLFWIIVRR